MGTSITLSYLSKVLLFFLLFLSLSTCAQNPAFAWGSLEQKLIYYPINRHMADVWVDLDKQIQDTYYYSLDGTRLNGWYIPAVKDKPTIVYCHGQGENISLWQSIAKFADDNGYGIFMIDYRGHGKSEGSPSESGLYLDLESSIKYLNDNKNIKNKDIILWGRSLGGAVVADVASRDNFKGVILESTFTNIRDEAIHLTETGILESSGGFWSRLSTRFVKHFPMTQRFSTDKKIQKISSPLLITASINDTTIPCCMSKILAQGNPNATLFLCQKGSHHSSEWVKPEVLAFLKGLG